MAGLKISRGDVYLVSPAPHGDPRKRRPVVVVSRQSLCESRSDNVVCAGITTHIRGLLTEVRVGQAEGLKTDSVINCDQLFALPKSALTNYLGMISHGKRAELNTALRNALDV